jgi:hypothetical protein
MKLLLTRPLKNSFSLFYLYHAIKGNICLMKFNDVAF